MKSLLELQFRIELRRRSVLMSLLLYLVSLILINYFALGTTGIPGLPTVWSALFWMAVLSTAVNVITKSFSGDRPGTIIYYYSVASPEQIILSRMLYGFLLCLAMSLIGYFLFALFLSNPIRDLKVFLATVALVSLGFSSSLTLLSAIASKTRNSNVVMAVLSFPVLIGLLLMAVRATKNSIDGLDPSFSYDEMLVLTSINLIVAAVSYLLFPYIWRS